MTNREKLTLLATSALSRWFIDESWSLPSLSPESVDQLPHQIRQIWEAAAAGCPRDPVIVCTRTGLNHATVGLVISEYQGGSSDCTRKELAEVDRKIKISVLAARLKNEEIGTADLIANLGKINSAHIAADVTEWRSAPACQWVVGGILQTGCVTVLSAVGGLGKSLLALDLAVRVASGDPGKWLDTFELPGQQHKMVILDAECGTARIKRRIRELVEGGSFPAELVDIAMSNMAFYTVGSNSSIVQLQDIPLLVSRHQPSVVVVDPLRCFLPQEIEDENGNIGMGKAMDTFVAMAKQFGVAILVVAHSNRQGQPLRGASASRDSTEFLWDLTSDGDDLKLQCNKSRDPVPASEVVFRVVPSCGSQGLNPMRFETSKNTPSETGTTRRVHQYLTLNGESSIRQIVTGTGIARSSVRDSLRWLTHQNAIITRVVESTVLYTLTR